jgi:hypothetical protein
MEIIKGCELFDPAIHTKEYLLSSNDVLRKLAEESVEFAKSELAQDSDILTVADRTFGYTVAHLLAEHQPCWSETPAASNIEILKLEALLSGPVACILAQKQPAWTNSSAVKDHSVLKMKDYFGYSIAYHLQNCHQSWIETIEANDKTILTIVDRNKILAEHISDEYTVTHQYDVVTMAMKLIKQGAAYKHSKYLAIQVGEEIFSRTGELIEKCSDELTSLSYALATYATFMHNYTKILNYKNIEMVKSWGSLTRLAEKLIIDICNTKPDLLDIDLETGFFCEPAHDLIQKLKSEKILLSLSNLEQDFGQSDDHDMTLLY